MEEMKIVDSNEPEIIRNALKKLGWEQSRLHSADFAFMSVDGQSIGIERKAVPDLISSLTERLPLQFYKQIEDYQIPVLLIEGHWGMQLNKITCMGQIYNITWEQVWNFVRTWQDKGLTLEITIDIAHTIERVEQLYNYYQKPGHSGGIDRTTSGDSRLIALQCHGIGIQLAQKLLTAFGSLQKIANADYVEFAQVEGIGMKKAMEVYRHFRKE
jgi:ERCC4-type nuclease